MAAVFRLFQRKDSQQELYEPSPRYGLYVAAVDGQLYLYSGRTVRYTAEKEKLQSVVEVLDPQVQDKTCLLLEDVMESCCVVTSIV